jgi:site-specific recombinase XerD
VRTAVVWAGSRGAGRPYPHGGPGTGWDPHELRHSALTHLGEGGASLLMLMAKPRHKKTENLRRYFHPTREAIAEVTSLLGSGHLS